MRRKGYYCASNKREKEVEMDKEKCSEECLLTCRRASFRSIHRFASISRGYPRVLVTSVYHFEPILRSLRAISTYYMYINICFKRKCMTNALRQRQDCHRNLL